jgi:predicted tellurium resistance membrane protein TerC
VVWGSKLVLTLMDRFPVVITLGAALLGWIAGGMLLTDPAMPPTVAASVPYASQVFAATGALLVVLVGKWLGSRRQPVRAVELSAESVNPKN